ncbi:MAG: hypothetical protein JWL83_2522, partial [Actinomycetia bacterium]|nr:hypothetical protein [Actinomycetes bacterium]
ADVKRADDVLSWLATQTRPAASPAALQTAAYLLRDEPGLNLVRNWRAHGAHARPAPAAAASPSSNGAHTPDIDVREELEVSVAPA